MTRPSVAAARAAARSTGGGIGNRPGGRDRNSAYCDRAGKRAHGAVRRGVGRHVAELRRVCRRRSSASPAPVCRLLRGGVGHRGRGFALGRARRAGPGSPARRRPPPPRARSAEPYSVRGRGSAAAGAYRCRPARPRRRPTPRAGKGGGVADHGEPASRRQRLRHEQKRDVEQLGHGLDADHARLPQQAGFHVGRAGRQRHDRFAPADPASEPGELARVADGLEVEQHDVGGSRPPPSTATGRCC